MSQLDDILDKAMGYDGNDYAEGFGRLLELSQQLTKQQLKDLMLALLDSCTVVERRFNSVTRETFDFISKEELRQKVQAL